MEEINITLPAIDPAAIETLNQLTSTAETLESEAFRHLRESYGSLAKHAGYIRIAHYRQQTNNFDRDEDVYLERDGKQVRALLAGDTFTDKKDEEFRGRYTGSRLYLTPDGWIEITRDGRWSQWQNSANYWGCGCNAADDIDDAETRNGQVTDLTDTEASNQWELKAVLEQLGKSLTGLRDRIPERMVRIRQRAELAEKLIADLTAEKKAEQ